MSSLVNSLTLHVLTCFTCSILLAIHLSNCELVLFAGSKSHLAIADVEHGDNVGQEGHAEYKGGAVPICDADTAHSVRLRITSRLTQQVVGAHVEDAAADLDAEGRHSGIAWRV